MGLTSKTCVPCRGGVPPMAPGDIEGYLKDVPGWALTEGGTRLQRHFVFDDFAGALKFANRVGELAEREGHHPDITIGWGYCTVVTYTHKIGGLHENDFILAAKINQL